MTTLLRWAKSLVISGLPPEPKKRTRGPYKRRTIHTNECIQCGQPFVAINRNRKVCSDHCSYLIRYHTKHPHAGYYKQPGMPKRGAQRGGNRIRITREMLLEAYSRDGVNTLQDVGNIFGVTRERIRQLTNKYGIERKRNTRFGSVTRQDILDAMGRGCLTQQQIADELAVTDAYISTLMHRYGLKTYRMSRYKR